jgi:hypothetical protein
MFGDSTMQQTATTLMNSLFPAKCQEQITSIMSDTLIGENFGVLNRGPIWYEAVQSTTVPRPDIVILSAGAHITVDDDFVKVMDTVLAGIQRLKRFQPGLTIVWKTQQPGGCTHSIFEPKNVTKAATTSLIVNQLDASSRIYNWKQFYQRDLYVLSRLQELDIPYLDMRMLYSRSDAHPSSSGEKVKYWDCLHLCSPGPLDVIAPLFQNFLVQRKSLPLVEVLQN